MVGMFEAVLIDAGPWRGGDSSFLRSNDQVVARLLEGRQYHSMFSHMPERDCDRPSDNASQVASSPSPSLVFI